MTTYVLTKWLPLNAFSKHRSKLTNRRAQTKLLDSKAHGTVLRGAIRSFLSMSDLDYSRLQLKIRM